MALLMVEVATHTITRTIMTSIARLNCWLQSHLETYGDLLLKQIELYDADIILCCGGSNLIKDFVKEMYLPDLEAVTDTDWTYYSKSANKLVINSYHPSYPGCSPEKMYESMMRDVEKFLDKFPLFTKPHR